VTKSKAINIGKTKINAFPKEISIRSSQEIGEILRNGKRINGKNISIIYKLYRCQRNNRVAFITSKKVRRAVDRNRLKRLMRETFRLSLDGLRVCKNDFGLDLILYANRISATILLKDIEKDFNQFLLAIDKDHAS